MKRKRGFVGIAFFEPKDKENVGTVFRNAHCFNADFICAINSRTEYKQASNTSSAEKHIPVFKYKDINDFLSHLPVDCEVVSVEVDGEDIKYFKHPERVIYLFGGEDRTLPNISGKRLSIETQFCLNMAVTSAIVLYDRQIKNS